MALSALRFYGIVPRPERGDPLPAPQTSVIVVRDLGAVVRPAEYAAVERTEAEVAAYRAVVESAFEHGTILPAPFGVVFRGADQVEHWLRMHYIALTEGMHLVEGRAEVRVHIGARRDEGDAGAAEGGEDAAVAEGANGLAGVSSELARSLRRRAIASVPLRRVSTHPVLSTAFLVDRTRWDEFAEHAAAQAKRFEELRVDVTGPWPPYDFVRMDLGV